MGFFRRKTSGQTSKLTKLLKFALARLATARRPCLARKSISCGDVSHLLVLGHLVRALHRAELVIEDNMLEAFHIVEFYYKRLIEHAALLDNPQECGEEEIREAAVGILFAARWCGDLPVLPLACTILEDKFGNDFTVAAKEGSGIVDHGNCYNILVWKLFGDKTHMELKKKVTREIAADSDILMDFSVLQEEAERHDNANYSHC